MKLEMLRTFRAVARSGGLAGAARSLGRTPSAVSMTLTRLEAEIGGALFETERKARLTALGRLVLDEARRATDAFDRAEEAIGRHARSTAGTVRVAAVPSATVTLLPSIVGEFQRRVPGARLEVSDADSAEVRRRTMLDEADIGILSGLPGEDVAGRGVAGEGAVGESGASKDIAARPFGETVLLRDELGIVCRPDGPIAEAARDGAYDGARDGAGEVASWGLLALEPFIGNPLAVLLDHPLARDLMANASVETRNTSTLLGLVRSGLGATILPRTAVSDPGLVFVAPLDPPAWRELRKIGHPDLGPAARTFWQLLAEAVPRPRRPDGP